MTESAAEELETDSGPQQLFGEELEPALECEAPRDLANEEEQAGAS